MDVIEAVARLRRAHAATGLCDVSAPGAEVEDAIDQIAAALAPLRLPADLVTLWRSVDPDSLTVAPCPRPAGPELSLRLWREHFAGRPDLARFFPWCYESHDFMLVELDGPAVEGHGCFSWTAGGAPVVRTFTSVAAYVDLWATMIELREFTYHPQLGVLEFDPERRWSDAQLVRLAADRTGPAKGSPERQQRTFTTVANLRAAAARGESPSGVVRARVLSLSGSASGARIQVTDGTGRLDMWCPASLCGNGPVIDRRYEFDVTLRPGCPQPPDAAAALGGVERATRRGDIRAAVLLATPLYDRLYRTPAAAQARSIRPAG
jgi:hypothetical protein